MSTDNEKVRVVSYNQSGGITAQNVTVHNQPQRRTITPSISEIAAHLKQYPPVTYRLHYSTNDPEASRLAAEIDSLLALAGWDAVHPIQRMGGPSFPSGITLFMIERVEAVVALADALWRAFGNQGVEGQVLQDVENVFRVQGWAPIDLPHGRHGAVIFVGPNPNA